MSTEDNSEGDVPPLEDMAEYVDKLKHVSQGNTSVNCPVKTTDRSLLQLEREDGVAAVRPQLLINSSHETTEKKCVTADKVRSQAPQSKGGFGGMKKGFFGGSGGRKREAERRKKQESVDDIPLLQGKQESTDSLRLEEVQDELRRTHPLLSTKEWVSDNLLSTIDKDPVLSRAFKDPSLFRVLEEFHNNPKQALAAAQHNPEVREFLQHFCSVMGDHFTSIADTPDNEIRPPLISEQPSEEERQVQDLLKNPSVKDALLDSDIVNLMEILKTNPTEAQRFLNSIQSKPGIQTKLKTLIDNGLLSIQRTT